MINALADNSQNSPFMSKPSVYFNWNFFVPYNWTVKTVADVWGRQDGTNYFYNASPLRLGWMLQLMTTEVGFTNYKINYVYPISLFKLY